MTDTEYMKIYDAGYKGGILDAIYLVEEAATVEGAIIKLQNKRIKMLSEEIEKLYG